MAQFSDKTHQRIHRTILAMMEEISAPWLTDQADDLPSTRTHSMTQAVVDKFFTPNKRSKARSEKERTGWETDVKKVLDSMCSEVRGKYEDFQINSVTPGRKYDFFPMKDGHGNLIPFWAYDEKDQTRRSEHRNRQVTAEQTAAAVEESAKDAHVANPGTMHDRLGLALASRA